jgi:hypothetical protein
MGRDSRGHLASEHGRQFDGTVIATDRTDSLRIRVSSASPSWTSSLPESLYLPKGGKR